MWPSIHLVNPISTGASFVSVTPRLHKDRWVHYFIIFIVEIFYHISYAYSKIYSF